VASQSSLKCYHGGGGMEEAIERGVCLGSQREAGYTVEVSVGIHQCLSQIPV
jgi:hypothetical protein